MTITDQHTQRVAIQGYAGAFHEIAARRFYDCQPISIFPAPTFERLVEEVAAGQHCDSGLMAIENTLAGSLLSNYSLLQDSKLHITGEVYLPIRQNLLARPGATLHDLREVHSHPIAIAQCRQFFRAHPQIRLVETLDTALSARQVSEQDDPGIGAIASTLAAELYGLHVLARDIETNRANHTRFLVLDRKPGPAGPTNKCSISFAVDHRVGSLQRVLAILSSHGINLTKIQSAPITGHPWEYRFYVDFLLQPGETDPANALAEVAGATREFRLLGCYREGNKNLNP